MCTESLTLQEYQYICLRLEVEKPGSLSTISFQANPTSNEALPEDCVEVCVSATEMGGCRPEKRLRLQGFTKWAFWGHMSYW